MDVVERSDVKIERLVLVNSMITQYTRTRLSFSQLSFAACLSNLSPASTAPTLNENREA